MTATELPAEKKKCRYCASELNDGARKCLECESWQNLMRFVPASQLTLALLISLISVLSAVVPPALAHFANHSHTYVRILGDEALPVEGSPFPEPTILLLVANNGKRPSLVKSASISFEGINAAPAELEIRENNKRLIGPGEQVPLHVTVVQVERTKAAAAASPESVYATITVVVEETNVRGDFVDAALTHRVATTLIPEWMDRYVKSN